MSSLIEDMEDFGLRLAYQEFLMDTRNPLMEFEEWKARREIERENKHAAEVV